MTALTEKLGCVFCFRFIIVLGFCLGASNYSSLANDDDDEYVVYDDEYTQRLNIDHWLPVRALVQSLEDLGYAIEKDWRPSLIEILSTLDKGSMEGLSVEDQEALKALGDTFPHRDWVPDTEALHRIVLKQSYKRIEQPLKAACFLLRDYYEEGWRSLNWLETTEHSPLVKDGLDWILEGGLYFLIAFTDDARVGALKDEDWAMGPRVWGLVDQLFEKFYFKYNGHDGNAALLSEWFDNALNENLVLSLENSNVEDIEAISWFVDWKWLNQAYLTDSLLNAYFSSYQSYLIRLQAEYNELIQQQQSAEVSYNEAEELYAAFLFLTSNRPLDDQYFEEFNLLSNQQIKTYKALNDLVPQVKRLKALLRKAQAHFEAQYAVYQKALEPYAESLALVGGMQFGGDLEMIRQQILTPWLALEEVLLHRLDYAVQALNDLLPREYLPEVVTEALPLEVFVVEPLQRLSIDPYRVQQLQGRTASEVNPLLRYAVLNTAEQYPWIWPLPEAPFEPHIHAAVPLWGGSGPLF